MKTGRWNIRVVERVTCLETRVDYARKRDAEAMFTTLINTIDPTKVRCIELVNPHRDIVTEYYF